MICGIGTVRACLCSCERIDGPRGRRNTDRNLPGPFTRGPRKGPFSRGPFGQRKGSFYQRPTNTGLLSLCALVPFTRGLMGLGGGLRAPKERDGGGDAFLYRPHALPFLGEDDPSKGDAI